LVERESDVPAADRTLLVRRLALSDDTVEDIPEISSRRSMIVDLEAGTVVVRRAGRLVVLFQVSVGGSELAFRYRFRDPRPGGRADVTVGRRYAGPKRYDVVREIALAADKKTTGRFRQKLHDRGEPSVLFVDVNAAAAEGGFVVQDLKLVARPEAAKPNQERRTKN
jgi:hypothetical protein